MVEIVPPPSSDMPPSCSRSDNNDGGVGVDGFAGLGIRPGARCLLRVTMSQAPPATSRTEIAAVAAPAPSAPTVPAPAPRLSVQDRTRSALSALRGLAFDADCLASGRALLMILDNVLRTPFDAVKRSLRRSNARFHQAVGRWEPAVQVLRVAGFVGSIDGDPLGAETVEEVDDAEGGSAPFLVLSPGKPQEGQRLRAVRSVVASFVRELGGDPGDAPPADREAERAASAVAASFDPFRPLVMRMAPQPRSDEATTAVVEPSLPIPEPLPLTSPEAQLDALRARRRAQVGDVIPARCIRVMLPGSDASATDSISPAAASASASALATTSSGGDDEDGDASMMPGDMRLLQQVRKRQMEEARSRDTLQTRAMRELQSLSSTKVFTEALVRVTLPSRTVIEARFNPYETIAAVRAVLDPLLVRGAASAVVELFTAPPLRVLADTASLQDLGLVPAGLIRLRWTSTSLSSSSSSSSAGAAAVSSSSAGVSPSDAVAIASADLTDAARALIAERSSAPDLRDASSAATTSDPTDGSTAEPAAAAAAAATRPARGTALLAKPKWLKLG